MSPCLEIFMNLNVFLPMRYASSPYLRTCCPSNEDELATKADMQLLIGDLLRVYSDRTKTEVCQPHAARF